MLRENSCENNVLGKINSKEMEVYLYRNDKSFERKKIMIIIQYNLPHINLDPADNQLITVANVLF